MNVLLAEYSVGLSAEYSAVEASVSYSYLAFLAGVVLPSTPVDSFVFEVRQLKFSTK